MVLHNLFRPVNRPSRPSSASRQTLVRLCPAVLAAALAACPGCAGRRGGAPIAADPAGSAHVPAGSNPGRAASVGPSFGNPGNVPGKAAVAPRPAMAVDLSTPRGAMTTYYRAVAAGDAEAAKAAVMGDEMALRYIDAAATLAAGVRELDAALTARFGRDVVGRNDTFAAWAASYRADDAAKAIANGDSRVSGDIAIVTPRLPPTASADAAPGRLAGPVQPMPGVLRNSDGGWKLLIGAMRRHLYGKQVQEAEAGIEGNFRRGKALQDLAREVSAGKYRTADAAWQMGSQRTQLAMGQSRPVAIAQAPTPAAVPQPPPQPPSPTPPAPSAGTPVGPKPVTQPAVHVAQANPVAPPAGSVPHAGGPSDPPPGGRTAPKTQPAAVAVVPPAPVPAPQTQPLVAVAPTPAPPAPATVPAVAVAPTPAPTPAAVRPPDTNPAVAVATPVPNLPAAHPTPPPAPSPATVVGPSTPPVAVVPAPRPLPPAAPPPKPEADVLPPGGSADAALVEVVNRNRLDMVKAELARGGDVNAKDPLGRTALHRSAIGGEMEIVNLLLEKGADIKARDSQGWTPLHWAASSGHADVAALLIDRGAAVEGKGELEDTPLHWAAIFDHRDVVELLLAKGADVNARDGLGKTPLHAAIDHDATDVAGLLLDKGADVAAKDESGAAPIHAVVQHAHQALEDLALTAAARRPADGADGADAGGPTADDILRRAKKMVDLLVAHGADVNAKTARGDTALHLATWDATRPLAEALIAKGADVSAQDTRGKTALELATEHKQPEAVRLFAGR